MIGALTANARADWGPWLDDVCPGLREELPDVIPEAEAVPFPAIQAFCNPADTISGPRDGSLDWAARRSPHPVNTSHASTPLQNTPILVDSSVASSSGDEQEFGGIIGGEENEETDEDKEDDEDAEESDESGENDGAAKVTDAATKSVPASVDEDVEMAGLSTSGSSDIPLALAVPLTRLVPLSHLPLLIRLLRRLLLKSFLLRHPLVLVPARHVRPSLFLTTYRSFRIHCRPISRTSSGFR